MSERKGFRIECARFAEVDLEFEVQNDDNGLVDRQRNSCKK